MVITKSKVSLADHLNLKELPLATTPGGKNFCLKALHPSEHTIKAARVPGGNKNSVALQADLVATISIPDSVQEPMIRVTQAPNIMCPALIEVLNYQYTQAQAHQVFNPAFGGGVVESPTAEFVKDWFRTHIQPFIKEYRITSQSMTAELVAPAVADQGTVVAAVYHNPSQTSEMNLFTGSGSSALNIFPDATVIQTPPNESQLMLGTSAYTGKARDGCYQPLKISKFKWMNCNDPTWYFNVNDLCDPSQVYNLSATDTMFWPISYTGGSDYGWPGKPVFPKMCGTNYGIIYFRGLSNQASLRIRMRQVVEITAYPSTTYAPLLEPALPPDETAMKMYFEISARMNDGYPASYNDLGKLKDIIMGIGKTLAPIVEPVLSSLPVVGPVVTAAKAAVPAVKAIKETVQKAQAASQKKKALPKAK